MKVLVTGCRGQLGSKVVDLLGSDPSYTVEATDRARLDVTRPEHSLQAAADFRPDWIVNCTAYTDVDRAESQPEAAFRLNDLAVGFLADAALSAGARLLHVSTDYVFSGEPTRGAPRPYTEEDPPGPLSTYGASKLAGEERLRRHPVPSLVLRTSWLYGGPGRNFLHTMLRVGREALAAGRPVRVVCDQIGTPTDAWSLAAQVRAVLECDLCGIVHASAHGTASWYDFALEIFRLAELAVQVEPIGRDEYPSRARRPAYSALENRRLRAAGLDVMPEWRKGLEQAWKRLSASQA